METAQMQYMPGDPRLVDQLVYELKSKGIFDQFRKECIADVDTRPAYQNLRQRVESSVASFLARQKWKPDLNKNQLREKLRKHLLDGNYLEQGVERIVDQVVNPKVASVFIPQVEDLVYNYLGIPRKKTATETAAELDLLPKDLEAVSPDSVKSNDEKKDEKTEEIKMDVDESQGDSVMFVEEVKNEESHLSGISELTINDSEVSMDKSSIPLPAEEIKLENIPAPDNSPPNIEKEHIDLEKINLPKEPNLSTDIPLPDEIPKEEKDSCFKPLNLLSEDDSMSDSDSSLRRNMSPLTPIRNYNNENSCDAQQGFENDSDEKSQDKIEPNTFRFTIEKTENGESETEVKIDKTEPLPYHFSNEVDRSFNTPNHDDSSNSNNLQIDYESDVNSKSVDFKLPEKENSGDSSRKDKKDEKRSSSHKSSHRSREHKSSSSKDRKEHKTSRDSSRHDKKSSKNDKPRSHRDKSETDKKDSKDIKDSKDKHRSSSSHKSSHKDSHRSSSSSKHSSQKDDKKSSSSREKSDKPRDKDRSNSKSSSHKSDKDRNNKTSDEKDRDKKKKKETDDHYSHSGRGNTNRRSTDRDSNDGSSSSKGSHNPSGKTSESKKGGKTTSKSDNTSTSSNSDSPSDRERVMNEANHLKVAKTPHKPVVKVNSLNMPVTSPSRLPFVPDVTMKKPKFASNMAEAKKLMKMRKFLEDEQKRMNQEAALLLEFQANVRPSLSQVYSSLSGPELEFACGSSVPTATKITNNTATKENDQSIDVTDNVRDEDADTSYEMEISNDIIAETLIAMHREHGTHRLETCEVATEENIIIENNKSSTLDNVTEVNEYKTDIIVDCESQDGTAILCSPKNQISQANNENIVDETKNATIIEESCIISENETNIAEAKPEIQDGIELADTDVLVIDDFSQDQEVSVALECSEVQHETVIENQLHISEIKIQDNLSEIQNSQDFSENLHKPDVFLIHDEQNIVQNLDKQDTICSNDYEDKSQIQECCPIEEVVKSTVILEAKNEGTKVKKDSESELMTLEDISVYEHKDIFPEVELPMLDEPHLDHKEYDKIIDQDFNTIERKKSDEETVQNIQECVNETETNTQDDKEKDYQLPPDVVPFQYFAEDEKINSNAERYKFDKFLKSYTEKLFPKRKIFVMNCDRYEHNLIKDAAKTFGDYDVVNFHKNGYVRLPNKENKVVKNVNLAEEVLLPIKSTKVQSPSTSSKIISPMFSPRSECSFELLSDYDAKLEEMINKTSRQQVMDIILGGSVEEPVEIPEEIYSSPTFNKDKKDTIEDTTTNIPEEVETKKLEGETPKLYSSIPDNVVSSAEQEISPFVDPESSNYNSEKQIINKKSSEIEGNDKKYNLKRKIEDFETGNNNTTLSTPKKLRTESDDISSTTEETEAVPATKTASRSKYLGKAKRVGLSKPKKTEALPHSPSSDKSVENYEQNATPQKSLPNGKMKLTPRAKVQRYDTSDLYKPKLHYLSRRNNVS